MIKDTPKKKRIREGLIKKFSQDWEVDYSNGPTIRRKEMSGITGFFKNLFSSKHSVFAMYWFFKHDRLNNEESRKFYFPIKHDNIPTPGVPFKYEMQGTWRINEDDLRFLYGGPLIDQHGDLLVPAEDQLQKAFHIAKMVAPIFVICSAILAMTVNYFNLLKFLQ